MERSSFDTPEFMEFLKGGAQWAFRLFYNETIVQVKNWVTTEFISFSEVEIEDSIAKAYYTVFKNKAFYTTYDHIRGTLFTIVKNEMIDLYRKRGRVNKWKRETSYLERSEVIVQVEKEPDYLSMVEKEVVTLPPRMKNIIIKYYLKGKDVFEISNELGISPQTVRNLRNRAVERLRKQLPFAGNKLRTCVDV